MTAPDRQTLDVALATRSYPIHIGAGVLDLAGRSFRDAGRAARDRRHQRNRGRRTGSRPLRGEPRRERHRRGDVVLVPDGEAHKNLATLQRRADAPARAARRAPTVLVALGGGVVGDITGFAAAIYQRGMPFVQVPTTLLAQVDSSVGGKTGINHPLGKNMIGAFYQPRAVLIDTDCLRTLPRPRARRGARRSDQVRRHPRSSPSSTWLEANVERAGRARLRGARAGHRTRAAGSRPRSSARDEREHGERALLNFGHTFGHAIENGTGYGTWLHGEAVALGMVIAAEVSRAHLCLAGGCGGAAAASAGRARSCRSSRRRSASIAGWR